MQDAARQTRFGIMRLFEQGGFHPRADLGQNFLIDLNLLGCLVEQARLTPSDVVLEVGTGTGGLTAHLARGAGHVVSIEIDHRVHALARELVGGLPNVTLLRGDALKNKNQLAPELLRALEGKLAADPARRLKLVANLPYSAATPVLSNLVASDLPWTRAVVTIQWELAQKLRAAAGSDDYGALSVWIQSQCQVSLLKKLGPTVFWPRPAVDSAMVSVVPNPKLRERINDRVFFHDFARRIFLQRRKLLRGVLAAMFRPALGKHEVDLLLAPFALPAGTRAEQLEVSRLVEIADAFAKALRPG